MGLSNSERKELHQYQRTNIQLLVTWYTFFITLNFVAAGWFGSELSKGGVVNHSMVYLIVVYFMIQNLLSVLGCEYAKKEIKDSKRFLPSLPCSLYTSIITLFEITLTTLSIFWLSLLLLAR